MPAAFASAPVPQYIPSLRLLSPLIEPDVRFSRIRLSDWFHATAHAGDDTRGDPNPLVLVSLRGTQK